MAAIKRFFEKKKINAKFKEAGVGHSLSENKPTVVIPASKPSTVRQQSTENRAGEAALLRLQSQQAKPKVPKSVNASWKHHTGPDGSTAIDIEQLKNEMCASVVKPKMNSKPPDGTKSKLAVDSLTFICPLCPTTLTKPEIYYHLRDCLENDFEAEPLMISITMIYSLNQNRSEIQNCVSILAKYLQNIIDNKGEEKYLKIRKSNKIFSQKVESMQGTREFLLNGCGFELKMLPAEVDNTTIDQEFYVLLKCLADDIERLNLIKQMLLEAEPLEVSLDRNVRVLCASSSNILEVPDSFFTVSASEIKKEHEFIQQEIESMQILRTKAMRDNLTPKRSYQYMVLRIRFPDGILLQGTFSCDETLKDLYTFVMDNLNMSWLPFMLVDSTGKTFQNTSSKLSEFKLAPASLLNFKVEINIIEELSANSPDQKLQYLKDETLALISEEV